MISIIVPVYNAESFLDRCIKSILAQSYTDIELLLINDGSSDNSAYICEKYMKTDSRVRFYTKKNGGAASARNFGIRVSKGEYIQFVDADDMIEENMTEKMYQALCHYNVDWVICGVKLISLRGTSFNLFGNHYCESMEKICDVIIKNYNKAICHSCWNKLYKKNLITSTMEENYVYGEDYIFNLNYLKNCSSLVTINEALYTYDCRNESVTRGKEKNKEETIKEQFEFSYQLFDKLFDSRELNSVLTTHFFYEIIMNIVYTHSVFQISKSILLDSLNAYAKYLELVELNSNCIFAAINKERYCVVVRRLKALRVKYVIKGICRRIASKV